jgi:membrane protease subunit HflC
MQKLPIIAIIVAVVFIILSLSIFTVDERETAIVLQFGQPKQVYQEAGLKIKMPWPIQNVRYFDGRILEVDPNPERVNISSDRNSPLVEEGSIDQELIDEVSGEPIIVDTFARYRITDPLLFLQRLQTEARARQQIENVMDSATRDTLGSATLREILSSQRSELMTTIRDRVNQEMQPRGVEIVDIRIVRADLTDRLRESTVNRMITERNELATKTRASGREKALEIKSTADKDRAIILAEAEKQAQIIKGQGDRDATNIYNKAYNQDPEFYAFTRSMDAYLNTFQEGQNGQERTRMILSPDSDFLRFLSESN